ncbi:MAG: hypothetical protein JJU33_12910 [Phycisphaerales bacterium]|nr:hypothetical protein [Phycisphaerales bacterium]
MPAEPQHHKTAVQVEGSERGERDAGAPSNGRGPAPAPVSPPPLRDAALILDRLKSLSADEEFRGAFARVLRWLTDEASVQSPNETVAGPAPAQKAEPEPKRAPAKMARVSLNIGDAPSAEISVPDTGEAPRPPEPQREPAKPARPEAAPPQTVVARARLKAEAARWAIERRRRIDEGADLRDHIAPTDKALIERARDLPNCYAWMLDPYASLPDDRALDDAAGNYECVADAFALTMHIIEHDSAPEGFLERAYELLAESCSALRVQLDRLGFLPDADQDDAFNWLRTRVFEDQIYIARHMRLSDPADPALWTDRQERIGAIADELDQVVSFAKHRRQHLNKLGYIAKRWDDFDADEKRTQTDTLVETVERLIELGLKPSDPGIRDALIGMLDDLPPADDLPGRVGEAVRFADEHLARTEADQPPQQRRETRSPEAEKAAALLKGKVAVIIGGQCRPRSRDALRDGLNLAELRWIATRPHEPIDNFASQVIRDDVDLVMLAIRWSSHCFENVKALCDAHGKPFVRLPRGYGVNQVASEVLNQVSEVMETA